MSWGRINNGGSGGKLVAAISVTYPAGSVCTCTNGIKTLKAKDTNGQWLFALPSAGEWSVSCTDGTNTASETVTVAEGTAETVVLGYSLVLLDGTTGQDNWTYTTSGGGTMTKPSAGGLQINAVSGGAVETKTTTKVNTTGYNTLRVHFPTITAGALNVYVAIRTSSNHSVGSNYTAYIKEANRGTDITTNVPIENYNDDYYISIGVASAGYVVTVDKVELLK